MKKKTTNHFFINFQTVLSQINPSLIIESVHAVCDAENEVTLTSWPNRMSASLYCLSENLFYKTF